MRCWTGSEPTSTVRSKPFPGRLWELFVAVTSGWPELQQLLLVRFLGFPVWDTLILPIVELSEIRQLRTIDIVRISPRDGRPGRLPPKELKGAAVHHFGAFFDRTHREHDCGGASTGPNNS